MTVIVTNSTEDVISIPEWLMKALNLDDGTSVRATVDGQTLSLSPVAEFLALRGVYSSDKQFEGAVDSIQQQWDTWTTDISA